MARGIAISAGIRTVDKTHYKGNWNPQLQGAEADAWYFKDLATRKGFEIPSALYTQQATSTEILRRLQHAAEVLKPGDFLLFFCSSHGGQVPNVNGDQESTGMDSTLCLYDRMLVDDELNLAWSRFRERVRILFITDSCHSGTVYKIPDDGVEPAESTVEPDDVGREYDESDQQPADVERPEPPVTNSRGTPRVGQARKGRRVHGFKAMPKDAARETYNAHRSAYDLIQTRLPNPIPAIVATGIHFAACHDDELTRDGYPNSDFTSRLVAAFTDGFTQDYHLLFEFVNRELPKRQTPMMNLFGSLDLSFEDEMALRI